MRRLYKGNIYRVHYARYRQDKNPLILVLYSSKKGLTHAININYLSPELSDQLIEFISKVATLRITGYHDMYSMYHNYIKRRLPTIIKVAYRTYHTKHIKRAKLVSKGFFEIKSFLWNLRRSFTEKERDYVKQKLKKAIEFGKALKKKQRALKIFSLFSKGEKVTKKEVEKRVNIYMDKVDEIMAARKKRIDYSKYTRKR